MIAHEWRLPNRGASALSGEIPKVACVGVDDRELAEPVGQFAHSGIDGGSAQSAQTFYSARSS